MLAYLVVPLRRGGVANAHRVRDRQRHVPVGGGVVPAERGREVRLAAPGGVLGVRVGKISKFCKNFGGLVLGCIKTKFCKNICRTSSFVLTFRG